MCSQVAPRQLVNSTEKGCYAEKSDFREDMAHSFGLKAGRSHSSSHTSHMAYEPPLTHKQDLPWCDQKAADPSAPDGGFVLMHYWPALLVQKKLGTIYLLLSNCLDNS